MLRFEKLRKQYGDHVLFDGLTLTSNAGCVALQDDNGTGKSTLLGILAGTLTADAGDVWLDGHSLRTAELAAKSTLAYVPDDCMAYPFLSGRGLLEMVAKAKQTVVDDKVLALAHRFGLEPHLDKRFEQMSLGTRKKFFLSATVLGDAKVIIADEPANGLDAQSRAVLADLFLTLGKDRCVFFSTHYPELIEGCEARAVSFADLTAGVDNR